MAENANEVEKRPGLSFSEVKATEENPQLHEKAPRRAMSHPNPQISTQRQTVPVYIIPTVRNLLETPKSRLAFCELRKLISFRVGENL